MNRFVEALVSDKRSDLIPEEYDYFGQFIGEWTFVCDYDYGPDCKGTGEGEWIFSWILKGTAIEDVFISYGLEKVKPGDELGATVRFFDPVTKVWRVFYGWLNFTAQLVVAKEEDKIVLTEVGEGKRKWIFSDIKPDSFHWQAFELKENECWKLQTNIYAKRK